MTVAELQRELIADEVARAAPNRGVDAWMVAADHLTWALEVRLADSDRHPSLHQLTDELRKALAELHVWLVELGADDVTPLAEWAASTSLWASRAQGEPTETRAALDWLLDDHGPIHAAQLIRATWWTPPAVRRKRETMRLMRRALEWLEQHPGAYLDTTPVELMPGIRALMANSLLVRDGGWSAPADWRTLLQDLQDEAEDGPADPTIPPSVTSPDPEGP